MKRLLLLVFIFCVELCGGEAVQSSAESVKSENFKNLYRVSKDVYRSEQPSSKGFLELEKAGVRSVLNLREYHSDDDEARGTSLVLYRVRLAAGSITEDELVKCLSLISKAEKPVLIHCLHGSDRTGAVIAAYRIIFENVSGKTAIAELCEKRFGHHKRYYPNIVRLIENLDIERVKREITRLDEKKSSKE